MDHATGMNRKENPFAIHETFFTIIRVQKSEPWGNRRGFFERSEK